MFLGGKGYDVSKICHLNFSGKSSSYDRVLMKFLLNFPFLGKTKLKSLTFSYCFEVW
jgi:hypothetical protein